MVLPHDDGKAAAAVNEETTPKRLISKILFIIAMKTEAEPLVNKFQLAEEPDSVMSFIKRKIKLEDLFILKLSVGNNALQNDVDELVQFPKGVPWVRYYGKYKDLNINIVCPGKDTKLGVDCVGTVSASLLTYASSQALKPDLIINAGTAGGFKAKGASICDVYLASDVAFHDRRIPIPVCDLYGVGSRRAFSTPNLAKELNLKVGKLSTGDSLDMSSRDEEAIYANDATIKDMEGAAIAYVADLLKVPAIFLKAVTDIVDGDKPTAEEFVQNLIVVTAALDQAATRVVDFINKKSCSEL